VPVELSVSIDAALSVSCWVPRSLVPNSEVHGSLVGDEGYGDALVVDEDLSTRPCEPLRVWME
jgi:hypothetical protein